MSSLGITGWLSWFWEKKIGNNQGIKSNHCKSYPVGSNQDDLGNPVMKQPKNFLGGWARGKKAHPIKGVSQVLEVVIWVVQNPMLKQPVTDVLCPLHFSKGFIYPLLNEGSNIYIYTHIYTWNPKQPALNGCLAKQQFVKSRFGIISSRFKKSLFEVEIITQYTA